MGRRISSSAQDGRSPSLKVLATLSVVLWLAVLVMTWWLWGPTLRAYFAPGSEKSSQSASQFHQPPTEITDAANNIPLANTSSVSGPGTNGRAFGVPHNRTVNAALAVPLASASAVEGHEITSAPDSIGLDPGSRQFVMSMCQDLQGNLWVGTEDGGVQRFIASGSKGHEWTQFTTKDGLGDDNGYAIACDRLGRIWAGHLNHGVSVYNGQKWQNYEVVGGLSRPDTLAGPLGERVFAIKVCPIDGDVWIASSCGLARYSEGKDIWSYYTRSNGLPSDQAQALAFDAQGNIYVGTQCDGIATADAATGYKSWRVTAGPDEEPNTALGTGLPSSLINDILTTDNGIVYAATNCGVAWSKDHGAKWQFLRGRDWLDKSRARNPSITFDPGQQTLLAEDYCTSLAAGSLGNIFIGHRATSVDCYDFQTNQVVPGSQSPMFTERILVTPEKTLFGAYGVGIVSATDGSTAKQIEGFSRSTGPIAALFPSGAKPPTENDPGSLADVSESSVLGAGSPSVLFLGDDWMTEGDWVGRYGRQHNVLCAASTPLNHEFIWENDYHISGSLGDNYKGRDRLRGWLHWLETDNIKCLYDPLVGTRRMAEWDDHGEAYPRSIQGPNINISVTVLDGIHRISLYFVNDDAHQGINNSQRDYRVVVSSQDSIGATAAAASRVESFYGGVYKQFLVRGPGTYVVQIQRAGSFNTICSGVFVDKVTAPPAKFDMVPMAWMGGVDYSSTTNLPTTRPTDDPTTDINATRLAEKHWVALDESVERMLSTQSQYSQRVMALRAATSANAPADLLKEWRWQLCLWTPLDRSTFDDTMQKAWAEQLKQTPILAKYQHGRPTPTTPG